MTLQKQTANELCPICDKPLSASPCSSTHANLYGKYSRKRRYDFYAEKATEYQQKMEGES